jgi:hypothetical protein
MVGGGLGVFNPAPCRGGDDDGDEFGGSAGLLFVPACVPVPVPFIIPTSIPMAADGLGVSVTSIVMVVDCSCTVGEAACVMVDACMIVDSIESVEMAVVTEIKVTVASC